MQSSIARGGRARSDRFQSGFATVILRELSTEVGSGMPRAKGLEEHYVNLINHAAVEQ
jgi:hypothetical protein